ncbi:MAG: GUN4 domain-containing protein [Elainellaceae cyanobacterium]
MSFDKFIEKLFENLISFGPATIFFFIAAHECWLYADPNNDGDLRKAFGFAFAGAAWAFVFKTLSDLWNEIWQSRRASIAKSLIDQIETFNKAVRWKLSSFDRQYLECQAYECDDYRVEGYKPFGIKTLMLEEAFVPLELMGRQVEDLAIRMVLRKHHRKAEQKNQLENLGIEQENNWKIWDFLAQTQDSPTYRRMAILAAVGYGKTTLLKHVTLSYAKQASVVQQYKAPKRIPILLYLRDLRELFAQDKETFPALPDLIHTHHLSRLPPPDHGELKPPDNWAANLLQTGRALVMFDGFDEVAEARRADVSEWISTQMLRYPRSVFILTSRPPGYEEHYTAEKPETTLYVRAFNYEQRHEFIHKWYTCQERYDRGGRDTPNVRTTADRQAKSLLKQLEQRPKLSEMAVNPLLLNMIATFHRFHPGDDLPKYRAALYADICKLQLVDRPRAKGIPMLLNLEQSQKLLQEVALKMMQHPEGRLTTVTDAQLQDWIRQPLVLINRAIKPPQWIEQIEKVSELLVEKEDRIYEFAHLSFQEYLAAAQIKALPSLESILFEKFEETEWRETILLYAAQTDPTPLVEEACRRNTRDALQLGYDCVRESPNQISAEVFEELQSQRYQTLAAHLSQGELQKADGETVWMMLRTVGKSEDQYPTPDELLTFPCDDLRRIDHLWVQHSNGKFGFSVQKEIYLECGGILDGKHHKEAFEKFGDHVGWRAKDDWTGVCTYNISAPTGHLPYYLWLEFISVSDIFLLFSRIQTCKV